MNASHTLRWSSSGFTVRFHERIMLKLVRADWSRSIVISWSRAPISLAVTYAYICNITCSIRKLKSRAPLSFFSEIYIYIFFILRDILSREIRSTNSSLYIYLCIICSIAAASFARGASFPPSVTRPCIHPLSSLSPLLAATRATRSPPLLSAGGATFKGHWMRPWMK